MITSIILSRKCSGCILTVCRAKWPRCIVTAFGGENCNSAIAKWERRRRGWVNSGIAREPLALWSKNLFSMLPSKTSYKFQSNCEPTFVVITTCLLTANFCFDKAEAIGFPIGTINVDLSKTFHTCRISGHGLSPTDFRWRPHDWPHQSELNIKDVKVTLFDTAMPCGETSNRVHGSIVIQKTVFVWMESTRSSLQMIWTVRINIPKAKCRKHATQPFVWTKSVFYNNGVSSWGRDVVWWLCFGCENDCFRRI